MSITTGMPTVMGDPHSPIVSGVYYAHIGWFLNDAKHDRLEASNPVIRDFSKAPEIAWLDRYFFVPPLLLALAMFAIGGMPWLVWGFCLPTVTLAHATFAINTVNHMFGSRRFNTIDESRNNPVTALFAVGEGWHNNHHRYQRAARNGFYWWEFDPTWYVIRSMAFARDRVGPSNGARTHLRRGAGRAGAPPAAAGRQRDRDRSDGSRAGGRSRRVAGRPFPPRFPHLPFPAQTAHSRAVEAAAPPAPGCAVFVDKRGR